ncbi:TetR/AcrR family transcriptional regulator [Streptomyces sp. Ncost-T10-10d]|uniref:TetR/AcrR family transcriptional regulator n=1 Tax=Streptomyces sp. Ncost-T10-10d TaxID=1839774 RepID=UPI00081F2744|nr:TetR/AcrR family transcriptional regulator [Streptomyces sp. Ncost-T10-10d]SCF83187.1 transcriptional regulator, TetR family [Streptomyces sp. Ncost-T10-10d]
MRPFAEENADRPTSRRERLRAELEQEALAAARRLIATQGVEALSLSAVAREVGVTPPALYRYFEGKAGLTLALYEAITRDFVSAVAEAAGAIEAEDFAGRLYAATRAVLEWSVANPGEFDLLMGAGYARLVAAGRPVDQVLIRELGGLFGQTFAELWRRGILAYPSEGELEPHLRSQVTAYGKLMQHDYPPGVAMVMITCWRQIYGLLCMAVYGHMASSFDDYLPLFENMMDDLLALCGVPRKR